MNSAASSAQKQLIIGAGPIGLAMAAALSRHGVAYDQVDASTGVGGNWRHGVYRHAHIVSSKRATAFADYPMPDNYPDFPSADQMLAYLESYARDRDLLPHCEFNKRVKFVRPLTKSWHVTFEDGETRLYKGVVVCNGHHWDKRYPAWISTFTGVTIHSKDYTGAAQLAGQRVLVVGGGNSGIDMACEAARFGRSCAISLRSGYWYLPKVFAGRPLTDLPIWGLPVFAQRLILRGIIKLTVGSYRDYGLQRPNHKLFERHPAFGTDLLNAIKMGTVTPKVDVVSAEGNVVTFADGSTGEYDVIVAATGFHTSFPFLQETVLQVRDGVVQAYAGAFPEGVRGLCIVGWAQARNGFGKLITPLANLYARLIAMQDSLEFPLGTLLAQTESIPTSHLVNPDQIRREIWLGERTLWLMKWRDRWQAYSERRTGAVADDELEQGESRGS